MRRKALRKRVSKRIFMANTVPRKRNMISAIPMRGGFRL